MAQNEDRVGKERSMRKRQLKILWKRLHEIQKMALPKDEVILKLGGAKQKSPSAWRLLEIVLPTDKEPFRFSLNKEKLWKVRQREGRYLLRTNLSSKKPDKLWEIYIQLVRVEESFRNLKGDLAIRPIYHQLESRIKAPIFISFLAYGLHGTLGMQLKAKAPGLTPRSVLEQMKEMQMLNIQVPTTDGRWLQMARYTQPYKIQTLLLSQLGLQLPVQAPPKITATPMG